MAERISDDGILYELSNCEVIRYDVDDEHFYFGGEKSEIKQYYMSLTRVLDIGGPFPEGLRQYLRVTSFDEQKERLEVTGARGTKLHDALDKLMRGAELEMKDYPTTYEKDAIVTFIRMIRFLDPKNYATELIVADPDLRIAGTLDFRGFVDDWKLICLLDPNKYLDLDSDGDYMLKEKWIDLPDNKKRVHIIIDWKFTGRNAYSHKVQVSAYKTMNNKSRNGSMVSRAFTWRYSPNHKHRFDFNESLLDYQSFKRIYNTTIEYLGEFPEPPKLKRYPKTVRLYNQIDKKGNKDVSL